MTTQLTEPSLEIADSAWQEVLPGWLKTVIYINGLMFHAYAIEVTMEDGGLQVPHVTAKASEFDEAIAENYGTLQNLYVLSQHDEPHQTLTIHGHEHVVYCVPTS